MANIEKKTIFEKIKKYPNIATWTVIATLAVSAIIIEIIDKDYNKNIPKTEQGAEPLAQEKEPKSNQFNVNESIRKNSVKVLHEYLDKRAWRNKFVENLREKFGQKLLFEVNREQTSAHFYGSVLLENGIKTLIITKISESNMDGTYSEQKVFEVYGFDSNDSPSSYMKMNLENGSLDELGVLRAPAGEQNLKPTIFRYSNIVTGNGNLINSEIRTNYIDGYEITL